MSEDAASEDLAAFEQRLTEVITCLQPATTRWRILLTTVSGSYSVVEFLSDQQRHGGQPRPNNGPSAATATMSAADIESVQLTETRHHHERSQPPHQQSPDHGSWLCCVPCYWLRRNNSVHKASLTVATLVVTSILLASPVLFLISSVPAREGIGSGTVIIR
ncbi:hypothetical protein C0J52_27278 [Blattella germanica]|nr:hypothetical protein C0J52_27278 [Blattella germanica]